MTTDIPDWIAFFAIVGMEEWLDSEVLKNFAQLIASDAAAPQPTERQRIGN